MPGIRRLSAVATVGVLAVVTFGIWSGVRPAAAWAGSAPTIAPHQPHPARATASTGTTAGPGARATGRRCQLSWIAWSITRAHTSRPGAPQPARAAGPALRR